MSNIGKLFGTSNDKECGKGVEIQYKNFSVTIHRAGGSNKKFGQTLTEKTEPYAAQMRRKTMSDEMSEQVMMETYAETIVIGWDGVVDDDGKAIPYTPEACVEEFIKWPEFYLDIKDQANTFSLFREENQKAIIKN